MLEFDELRSREQFVIFESRRMDGHSVLVDLDDVFAVQLLFRIVQKKRRVLQHGKVVAVMVIITVTAASDIRLHHAAN